MTQIHIAKESAGAAKLADFVIGPVDILVTDDSVILDLRSRLMLRWLELFLKSNKIPHTRVEYKN